MMHQIHARQLKEVLDDGQPHQVIDVREPDEFLAGHLAGARCIPLSALGQRLGEIDLSREITLVCQSGGRAAQAYSQLMELGARSLQVLEGGMSAWAKCGLPVRAARRVIPIHQQTMIGAGIIVLVGLAFGQWNPWFYLISAFAGTMLVVAGATGFCFMAKVLQRMPWNRVNVAGGELSSCDVKGASCHGA